MNDSQKIKMNLNIGDQRLTLNVPFDRQDFARDVEASVQRLYSQWRQSFSMRTDREILAMVTYQFASHYCEMKEAYEEALRKAEECLLHADSKSSEPDEDFMPFD